MSNSVQIMCSDNIYHGEPIRYLLCYGIGSKQFDDNRCNYEDMEEVKKLCPFGDLPIYTEGEKIAHQSVAICRYLGKKYNLSGKNDWEDLEIDAIVDTIKDFRLKLEDFNTEKDKVKRKERRGLIIAEDFPLYLGRLEEICRKNEGHLALKKLTWADFYFAGQIIYLNSLIKRKITNKKPYLKRLVNDILNMQCIREYNRKFIIFSDGIVRDDYDPVIPLPPDTESSDNVTSDDEEVEFRWC